MSLATVNDSMSERAYELSARSLDAAKARFDNALVRYDAWFLVFVAVILAPGAAAHRHGRLVCRLQGQALHRALVVPELRWSERLLRVRDVGGRLARRPDSLLHERVAGLSTVRVLGSATRSSIGRSETGHGSAGRAAPQPLVYDGFTTVLEDISFSVPEGSIVGLIGPNGSGKSTLIKSVFDLLRLQTGQVTVGGHEHASAGARTQGDVPREQRLPAPVPHGAGVRHDSRRDVRPHGRRGSRSQPLHPLLHGRSVRRPHRGLLHGMRKKTQLVSALLMRRPLTVIDETLNGIDIESATPPRTSCANATRGARSVVYPRLLALQRSPRLDIVFLDLGLLIDDDTTSSLIGEHQSLASMACVRSPRRGGSPAMRLSHSLALARMLLRFFGRRAARRRAALDRRARHGGARPRRAGRGDGRRGGYVFLKPMVTQDRVCRCCSRCPLRRWCSGCRSPSCSSRCSSSTPTACSTSATTCPSPTVSGPWRSSSTKPRWWRSWHWPVCPPPRVVGAAPGARRGAAGARVDHLPDGPHLPRPDGPLPPSLGRACVRLRRIGHVVLILALFDSSSPTVTASAP